MRNRRRRVISKEKWIDRGLSSGRKIKRRKDNQRKIWRRNIYLEFRQMENTIAYEVRKEKTLASAM